MYIRIRKNALIHQALIFFAAWTSFMKMAVDDAMHDSVAVISIMFGIILFIYAVCKLKIPHIIYILWAVFCLSGILNIILVGNLYMSVFISMIFSYFPISMNIVYADRLSCRFWKVNYIAASLYLLYRMMNSPDGVLLFEHISRNNLSVLLLAWLIIYAIVLKKNGCDIQMWTICLYCGCCIMAVGRFGIFVACVIFGCFWMYHFFYKTHHGLMVHARFLTGIIGIVFGILIFLSAKDLLLNKVFSRFAEVGLAGAEGRIGMVRDYFYKCDSLKPIIFGADRKDIPSIVLRSGNPHNSYVFVHMYFGITGMLFLIIGGISSIRLFFKKKQFSLMILAIGYFLRIFTDSVFPGSFGGDVVYWLFIFYTIQQYQSDDKEARRNEAL